METIECYRSVDGRLFLTYKDCLAYERSLIFCVSAEDREDIYRRICSKYPKVEEEVEEAEECFYSRNFVDICRHNKKTWDNPTSECKTEVFYIVNRRYRFESRILDLHDSLMTGKIFPKGEYTTDKYFICRRFAEMILRGNELTDYVVNGIVENFNGIESSFGKFEYVCKVIVPGKKWEIGCDTFLPTSFTIEKLF